MVKLKVVIKNVLFQIAILVVIFGGIEIFLFSFFPQIPNSSHNLGLKGGSAGYGLRPGAIGWSYHPDYGRIEYEINKEGFRDKSKHIIPKPEGVKRILILGDSFTFGQVVKYENTFACLLRDKLNELHEVDKYDIINVGVGGYSTTRGMRNNIVPPFSD